MVHSPHNIKQTAVCTTKCIIIYSYPSGHFYNHTLTFRKEHVNKTNIILTDIYH